MHSDTRQDPAALAEASTLLDEFNALLSAEYEALRGRDLDTLERVLARKRELIDAFEGLAAATDDPAMLESLRTRLEACRDANVRNGGAIEANQRLVNELIEVVHGRPRAGRLYAADGRVRSPDASSFRIDA